MSSNSFSVLNATESEMDFAKDAIELKASGKSWADICSDDEESENESKTKVVNAPLIDWKIICKSLSNSNDNNNNPQSETLLNENKIDNAEKNAEEERIKLSKRNSELSKLNFLKVSYRNGGHTIVRDLKVVPIGNFHSFVRSVGFFNTHRKDGSLVRKEQQGKIKMANENVLGKCYKHPTKQCCFVYPAAEIKLQNEKTILVDKIDFRSGRPFRIVEIEYHVE